MAVVAVRKDLNDLRIRLDAPFELNGSITLSDGSPAPQRLFVTARLILWTACRLLAAPEELQRLVDGGYGRCNAPAGNAQRRVAANPHRCETGRIDHRNCGKGDGASVLIVPESLAPGDMGWLLKCGPGGSFELAGMPPGEYAAIAVNNFDFQKLPLLSDIDRLRIIIRDATTVRIEEGAAASVQLKSPIDLP